MKIFRNRRMCIFALKYIPVITSFTMMMHVALLLFGIDYSYAEFITGVSFMPAVILLLMPMAFRFCWLHKSFIVYTLLVDSCIEYQRCFGFGRYVNAYRLIVFIAGVTLFVYLIINFKKYNSSCYDKKNACKIIA